MSNLIKLPYEISLWDDRLVVVGESGTEYEDFKDESIDDPIAAQYYKEHKLCVIGSNTMDSPIGAVEPNLLRKTDGTSTLTFSIYARYYDEEAGEFRQNPFIKYLTNERKVKLKYYPNGELRWLDFIIKKIDESSENYKFTYTATDLFINELSKTGYNLDFDTELENNQGTIVEMADKVLARTDWMVGEDSELIQQINEEPLYQIGPFDEDWKAKDIFTDEEIIIKAGTYIYTFYSVLQDNSDYFQFIYDGKIPENGIIHHEVDENNVIQKVQNCYCARDTLKDYPPKYYQGFRGQKYIRRQKTEYDKVLGEYVKVYQKGNDKVYGYSKAEYFTPSLITNYITNGNLILSNSGWDQEKDGSLEIGSYPSIGSSSFGTNRAYGIKYNNSPLLNNGFRDNAESIGEIIAGEEFVFRIRALSNGEPVSGFSIKVQKAKKDNDVLSTIGNPLLEGIANVKVIEDGKDYYYVIMRANRAVSYEELTDATSLEKFYIFISAPENKDYLIQHAELFKLHYGKVKDVENSGIILPNGKIIIGNSVSKDIAHSYTSIKYYYYLASETENLAEKPEQICYSYIGEEEKKDVYIPVYDSNFEKVRSISKKETNRFDLLQTLSETFECWCRFDVWHKETGEIMLGKDLKILIDSGDAFSTEKTIFLGGDAYSVEDYLFFSNDDQVSNVYLPYQQLKFVTFHNQIGQKKNIGFRYGTNLKSISRSLDSNTIATKLIVKSNTNEFANGGSCNIALAKENPSGENFIYDFSYYTNHGLMNETDLARDLYYYKDQQGWTGLYVSLKAKNKERDNLIIELVSCTQLYARNKSNFESAKLLLNTSNEQLEELKNEYYDITNESYIEGEIIPKEYENNDKVKGIVYNIELLTAKISQTELDYNSAKKEMEDLDSRTEEINKMLEDIEEETATLIEEFERKYIRFIQEASWTSEEYIDDNIYYFDAETTLHKASQPKASYTINVIELSQLEEYKDYVFDLGDITYIQDPDFFGWVQGKKFKTPYKEEIVITEMQTFFHNPEKCTIKVQNYRSSFEDLFKRLTASAQQIHFHSGEFQRAADIVDGNGNIVPSCLEDAFSTNMYKISNASNQTVKWDEFGITTTDSTNPAEITRITSGGMFLSDNGGEKWTTGITAKGINAKVITTGTLNTGLVNIYNGAQKSFTWDSQGINAYRPNQTAGYSISDYIRFNHEGIRGVENGIETFSLKDSGLNLTKGVISINNNNGNSVLIDPLLKNNGKVFEISVNNNKIMQIDSNGSANFQGIITAKAGGSIAGWNIRENALTKGNPGESQSFCMYTDASGTGSIGGAGRVSGWNLIIGSNFGVRTNNEGKSELWCDKVNITGHINASSLTIGNEKTAADKYIKNQITADHIATLGLEVGKQITMGANATISWNSVSGKPDNLATTKNVDDLKTYIGNNYVTTGTLNAWTINTNQINPGPLGSGITIGGLKIDNNSIYFGTWDGKNGIAPTVFMSTGSGYGSAYTICGQSRKDWVFGSGSSFGVTNTGKLYATGAELTGKIIATEGGNIGGWTIQGGKIYSGVNRITIGQSAQWKQQVYLTPKGILITTEYMGGNPVPPQNLKSYSQEVSWTQIINSIL